MMKKGTTIIASVLLVAAMAGPVTLMVICPKEWIQPAHVSGLIRTPTIWTAQTLILT